MRQAQRGTQRHEYRATCRHEGKGQAGDGHDADRHSDVDEDMECKHCGYANGDEKGEPAPGACGDDQETEEQYSEQDKDNGTAQTPEFDPVRRYTMCPLDAYLG